MSISNGSADSPTPMAVLFMSASFNAIVHTCYMFACPIQIRIEDKEIIISNRCVFPDGWTVSTLMNPHDSIPYNPNIAKVFYRAGFIEHWGRGIEKICDACKELGTEPPIYELKGNGLRVHFKALESALVDQETSPKGKDVTLDVTLNVTIEKAILELVALNPKITVSDIAQKLKVTSRTIWRKINKLCENSKIKRIGGKRYGHWEIQNESGTEKEKSN